MLDLKTVHRPTAPEEAVRLLAETPGRGLYLAGGTIVVPAGSPALDFLVDLSAAGLGGIRTDAAGGGPRTLVLGATATVGELLRSPAAARPAGGLLREAASGIANHTLRNLATVGGNLIAWHFPTDLPPALLVLDASLRVVGRAGERAVPLADLYARRREVFGTGDLIAEIRVPPGPTGLRGAFEKHGRKRLDVAIVNCAAAVRLEAGRISEARLALNGVDGVPARRPDVEAFLAGKEPSEPLFEESGRMVSATVRPRSDHRAGPEYRRVVAGVATKRALLRAAGLVPARGGTDA
jgi:CO/xanthine dehydrogenase FAD-binding subunit